MLHTVQDDSLKRVLDFLGLRGVVIHDYESTVLPVILVGDVGQPTEYRDPLTVNGPGLDNWIVDAGETWRPIILAGTLIQSAGAVGPIWGWDWLTGASPTFTRVPLPAIWGTIALRPAAETLTFTPAVNSTTNFIIRFPREMLMGSGSRIQWSSGPGDGALSIGSAKLLLHSFTEPLIQIR